MSRLNVIRYLLVEIERLYLALLAGDSIYEEWRDSLVTLGRRVQVKFGETIYEGVAESVAKDGSLTKIVAGDVTLRN